MKILWWKVTFLWALEVKHLFATVKFLPVQVMKKVQFSWMALTGKDFILLLCSYLFNFHYFHVNCSSEFDNCMSPPFPRPCCTRLFTLANPYVIQVSYARVNWYLHSSIPLLANSETAFLILYCLLPTTNVFKRGVKTPLQPKAIPPFWPSKLFSFH